MNTSAAIGAEPAPALSARGLSKIYRPGEVPIVALDDVDLDLYESELVVLLGPSGSGKSTCLNIVGGLDSPTHGEVLFRGTNLTRLGARGMTRYRRDYVGFVFQFYNLIASLTALENVELVTQVAADPMPALDALAMVGLADRKDHFPAQLSGGEQQRVAVARAIAKQPALLLCDEPTGALDSRTGVLVLEAIERVNRELGATTAVITHNSPIADMANRVLRFADGRIVEQRHNPHPSSPSDLHW